MARRRGYQRLLGIPATPAPRDDGCWTYSRGRVRIDLTRAPELKRPDGAIRLSGGDLPVPLLVVRGADRKLHAFCNRCGHRGRCVDPVDGGRCLQCCSVGRTTYDVHGQLLSGPASGPLETYPVRAFADKVRIFLPRRFEWSSVTRISRSRRQGFNVAQNLGNAVGRGVP